MGFTKDQLEAYRDARVPDLIGDRVRLLFVGINPGLWTAATQTHFCHPSNRFYPALRRAGLIDWVVDTDLGMTDEQRASFTGSGLGITNLVNRATVRASELTKEELVEGGRRLQGLADRARPRIVAVAGVTAYRDAFGRPQAKLGPQDEAFDGCEVWAVPNPSGLNAHETVESLASWYLEVATAADIT